MTPKFYAWLEHIAKRDQTLVALALVGMSCVVSWELLPFLPPAWAARLRPLYMINALLIFAGTAIAIYISVGGQR